jgi:hypothetical protein
MPVNSININVQGAAVGVSSIAAFRGTNHRKQANNPTIGVVLSAIILGMGLYV